MTRTRTTSSPRDTTRPARRAAGAAAALLGVVVLFQWSVVLGAPLGELTQGGVTIGPLSASGRWAAAASSLLLIAMALSILARAGAGTIRSLSPRAITVMTWLTGTFAGLTVVLNLASPSAHERAVWAPVSTAILLLVIATMVLTHVPGPGSGRRTRTTE